jgi:hypothetical protein
MATVVITVVPPVTAAIVVITAAADGNVSLSSMSGVHDHAGRQGRGVEQNDWRASHLDKRLVDLYTKDRL